MLHVIEFHFENHKGSVNKQKGSSHLKLNKTSDVLIMHCVNVVKARFATLANTWMTCCPTDHHNYK